MWRLTCATAKNRETRWEIRRAYPTSYHPPSSMGTDTVGWVAISNTSADIILCLPPFIIGSTLNKRSRFFSLYIRVGPLFKGFVVQRSKQGLVKVIPRVVTKAFATGQNRNFFFFLFHGHCDSSINSFTSLQILCTDTRFTFVSNSYSSLIGAASV